MRPRTRRPDCQSVRRGRADFLIRPLWSGRRIRKSALLGGDGLTIRLTDEVTRTDALRRHVDSNRRVMSSRDAPLWAITCYFNPMGWRRRLANYHAFRRRLSLPLITV